MSQYHLYLKCGVNIGVKKITFSVYVNKNCIKIALNSFQIHFYSTSACVLI